MKNRDYFLFINTICSRYIGVSNIIPMTSYVKMIDIWFIFCMTIPFLEVILQTYIEHLRYKLGMSHVVNHHGSAVENNKNGVQQKKITKNGYERCYYPLTKKYFRGWVVDVFGEKRQIHMAKIVTQRVVPVLALVFISVYFITGASYAYSSELLSHFGYDHDDHQEK